MSSHTVACAVPKCGYRSHILIPHLMEAHNLTATQYMERFPEDPLYSALGQKKLAERFTEAAVPVQRETEVVKMKDLFPGVTSDDEVVRFKNPSPFTPAVDENYVFPEEPLKLFLMGLDLKQRNRVYIKGYAGTGKTQLVVNALGLLNYEMFRLNGDSYITRAEMIGEWKVRGGEMTWQYGIVPTAMRRGGYLLVDEFDTLDPRALLVLRPVLEERPRLVLLENGGEVVTPGPDFRVGATANTWGTGDTTGLFGTSNVASVADRQRFSIYVKLDFLPKDVESRMLLKSFPSLEDYEVDAFLQVATEVREKHKEGKLDESFSPRQLVNWVEKYLLLGDVMMSARVCFLNAVQPDTEVTISEAIQRVFNLNPSQTT